MMPNLDMDALRSLVMGVELGSFARAAEAVGRSQSAVSNHLRKLERQIGAPLVQKSGRGLVLTEAGSQLLASARRLLDLNDQAVVAARSSRLAGSVRFGLVADFADTWLTDLLRNFAQTYPDVEIEVQAEGSGQLRAALASHKLDLVLAWGNGQEASGGEHLADIPARWIAHPDWRRTADRSLTLVAFDLPCLFRAAGQQALDDAGISARVAFNSSSLAGLWAALDAGLGLTVRTPIGMPSSLAVLNETASGLPSLPSVALSLYRRKRLATPAERLAEMMRLAIRERFSFGLTC
ncbi:LysR substrate-binding domain-containing protein [Sphingomonas abietis]|uniref:LysR substrate-binding domain-containing protein n=1 Tax=Sphingomonas abietis TaxID=3012344 RepID=A0ABY7NQU0_9SPHN|nr:LysR substrate-binding domain-containing protein [Sphingomonas abietis]WBO23888.1 LysR substrate-binding domain-containing protein [Sphingomonas abietis]